MAMSPKVVGYGYGIQLNQNWRIPMRTTRKDILVNITTTIWIVSNLTTYLITGDLSIVAVINMGFLLFLFLTLKDKKVMHWLNAKEK